MRYEAYPNDPERFATALRRDNHTKKLMWDNARGQDVLIVQTPFGQEAAPLLEALCQSLNTSQMSLSQFCQVLPGVWVRYVSAADKARNNGCPLHGEASTYTVFACQREGELCKIFRPQNQAMISQSHSIPLEIHVVLQKETRLEGFFRRREVETGFYKMIFPPTLGANYLDGSLCYRVGEFQVPVTKEMIEQGEVYIKTSVRPELVPQNKGVKIV